MTEQAATTQIPPIIHAIGGSLGSAVALLLFYPLERARIELQHSMSDGAPIASRAGRADCGPTKIELGDDDDSWSICSNDDDEPSSIVAIDEKVTLANCFRHLWARNELYRGVAPLVLTLAVSNYVFFYGNELMKSLIYHTASATQPLAKRNTNSYRSLIASCCAGICNVLITNPLWVANLRIVTGEATSNKLLKEMISVAKTDGIWHLWSGTGASLLLVSNPVLQFFLYEQLKGPDSIVAPAKAFVTGAVAKAVATIATYPLQLTQAVLRMQKSDNEQDLQYSGTWDCMVKLYRRDGVEGLFTGMQAKLLQTVLTAAFTFLTYEQIVTALHSTQKSIIMRRRQKLLIR
jgi:adenine nucleotide transporter 17